MNNIWEVWSTNDANGPQLSYNTIGFNNGGVGTSILHTYDAKTNVWTPTTQTMNGFLGK